MSGGRREGKRRRKKDGGDDEGDGKAREARSIGEQTRGKGCLAYSVKVLRDESRTLWERCASRVCLFVVCKPWTTYYVRFSLVPGKTGDRLKDRAPDANRNGRHSYVCDIVLNLDLLRARPACEIANEFVWRVSVDVSEISSSQFQTVFWRYTAWRWSCPLVEVRGWLKIVLADRVFQNVFEIWLAGGNLNKREDESKWSSAVAWPRNLSDVVWILCRNSRLVAKSGAVNWDYQNPPGATSLRWNT